MIILNRLADALERITERLAPAMRQISQRLGPSVCRVVGHAQASGLPYSPSVNDWSHCTRCWRQFDWGPAIEAVSALEVAEREGNTAEAPRITEWLHTAREPETNIVVLALRGIVNKIRKESAFLRHARRPQ
jgi:hypothetical protein